MIKLYTALGHFEMRQNKNGGQYPVVILNGEEYLLEIHEMILWSSLAWAIHTREELMPIYESKVSEAGIPSGILFEKSMETLESHGLIVSGQDYTGTDALYNLMDGLRIMPVRERFITKILAFIRLTFIKGVPFNKTKKIFMSEKLTNDETAVLNLIRKSEYTASELAEYFQNGMSVSKDSNNKSVNNDTETLCDSMNTYISRTDTKYRAVLQAIANLYLKKLILLERAKEAGAV